MTYRLFLVGGFGSFQCELFDIVRHGSISARPDGKKKVIGRSTFIFDAPYGTPQRLSSLNSISFLDQFLFSRQQIHLIPVGSLDHVYEIGIDLAALIVPFLISPTLSADKGNDRKFCIFCDLCAIVELSIATSVGECSWIIQSSNLGISKCTPFCSFRLIP
jgi:hypothetical protein